MTVRRALTIVLLLAASPVLDALSPDAWKHASRDYVVRLPADHVSHPAYRIEWWYYTGNLETDRRRRFGYQVTFFRIGINLAPANPSIWSVRDLLMAHVAVTDADGGRHLFAERVSRAGAGWAGASQRDLHVWNEDWEARLDGGRHRLQARDPRFAIDLLAIEDRPPVLHGERGFSQKGASGGNATHYYSLTRMPTEGFLTIDGERYAVKGDSWMDHEFGTSFLEKNQQGWDWFSLQLADGTDLMMFQLRRVDGTLDPQSSGTIVRPGQPNRRLTAKDFTVTPGRLWTSPVSAARYPVEWRVSVPGEGLDLRVRPVVDAQELTGARSGVSYWEGAIDVEGTRAGQPAAGRGYLEMTGYAGRALGEWLSPPPAAVPRKVP
jgi:predicted secreted hydrolase